VASNDPEGVVRRFCDAWGRGEWASLAGYFTEEATYHNIPMEPVTGREAIAQFIASFTSGVDHVEFRIHHLASQGQVVLTERTDVFRLQGRTVELGVMGAFEVDDGLISAWRDYFDLNQFMSRLQAG
jgi:limonene-1,2-epoxide hydrolase